jgi:hypothetical protein
MSYGHIQKAAFAVVLLTLTACETIARQEPAALKNSDHIVISGDRIGPISLGMSPKAVFQLLGPPSTTIGSTLLLRYGDSSFFVRADDTHQRVVQVAVYNDASFHTAEGARYGSTLQDLNRIWGSPYKWSRTHFCLIGESRSRLALTKQGSFSFLTSVRRDGFAARGYFTVRGRP